MKTVCIYHANCYDGLAAAAVVKRMYPDALFLPANYGAISPESIHKFLTDNNCEWIENAETPMGGYWNVSLIVVDFSFPRQIMLEAHEIMRELIVLDHHKTAQADCKGLSFCKFDMNESGATMAWKHFFPHTELPRFLYYIRDRDLWLHKEPRSKQVNAYIQSFGMDINFHINAIDEFENQSIVNHAITGGQSILRYIDSQVERIIEQRKIISIGGYDVPVVNCNVLMSEVGHALAKLNEGPFGAYYFDRTDGMRQWGARSIGDFDVSLVAKLYGGGGHKNASGWQHPIKRIYVGEEK